MARSDAAALAEVFRAIAATNQRLSQLALQLRRLPEVTESSADMRVYTYPPTEYGNTPEVSVELWAEAELNDGTGRTWWIELGWYPPRWHLDSSLLRDSRQGQDALFEGPVRYAASGAELATALNEATDELFALPLTCDDLGRAGKGAHS